MRPADCIFDMTALDNLKYLCLINTLFKLKLDEIIVFDELVRPIQQVFFEFTDDIIACRTRRLLFKGTQDLLCAKFHLFTLTDQDLYFFCSPLFTQHADCKF